MTKEKKGSKGGGKGNDRDDIAANDPIIITGGSMDVVFNPDFDDDDPAASTGHKKVKKVINPNSSQKIKGVDVYDLSGTLLNSYTLPSGLNGKCKIIVRG